MVSTMSVVVINTIALLSLALIVGCSDPSYEMDHEREFTASYDGFQLDADTMRMTDGRAIGLGHSIKVKSAVECASLCREHVQCDAVNYHRPSRKCRFFHRCVPYTLSVADNNDGDFVHYAKRPPVTDKGYAYDDDSDTCLKVILNQFSYDLADKKCHETGGRLAALTNHGINKFAAKLLRKSRVQYAWFGLIDGHIEGNPFHITGDKVSATGFFPKASQQHRNDSKRNCWSVSDLGDWAEHSCKGRKQASLCQIFPFSSDDNERDQADNVDTNRR